jgi:sugar phosphate isomerase/epimerase
LHLSYSTGATYCYPLSYSFKLAREAGFSNVELIIGAEAVWRGPEAVQRLAQEAGVTIRSVHGPIMPTPRWRHGPENITDLVDYAARLDPVPLAVVHVPKAEDFIQDAEGQRFMRELEGWQTQYASGGPPLALETPGLFHSNEMDFRLFDLDALADFAQAQGTGIVLDTVHVASLSLDQMTTYEKVRPALVNVHFSDLRQLPPLLDHTFLYSYAKHHQLPGAGELPLERLLERLGRDGYQGLLTLELSPVALRIWSPRQTRRLLTSSRDFVLDTLNGQVL